MSRCGHIDDNPFIISRFVPNFSDQNEFTNTRRCFREIAHQSILEKNLYQIWSADFSTRIFFKRSGCIVIEMVEVRGEGSELMGWTKGVFDRDQKSPLVNREVLGEGEGDRRFPNAAFSLNEEERSGEC